MKNTTLATLLAFALTATLVAADKEKDDHDHAAKAGPSGGRLITKVEPHAEFFVTRDRKIEIRFVDDDNKVVAPAAQTVSVIMGERSSPTKVAFAQQGDKLVGDKAIPDGDLLPTVVQIKAGPDGKTVTERFNLNLAQCPTCEYKEYACICDHDHEEKR